MSKDEIPAHLQLCDPASFSIKRTKWGRGYRFFNGEKDPVDSEDILNHLREVPVPNTWSEVRLSQQPDSYILAIGYDGSGKLQYLYHPDFLEYRNLQKFERLYDFGLKLPRIRRKVRQHLKAEVWNEEKLLALIVRILDKYHLRIGSRVYAREGTSFGLTTLRKKHLKEVDSSLQFQYIGKSGQDRTVELSDTSLVEMIREIADMPGWELFSFYQQGERLKATATKVNEYIHQLTKDDFSARTFRTWAGTVLAVKYARKARKIYEQNPQRKLKPILVELVAQKLGNTPAICEEYYIHPRVLEAVVKEGFKPDPCDQRFLKKNLFRKHECRTLEILSQHRKERE